jgi:long-chain acyl-CoA synthetase
MMEVEQRTGAALSESQFAQAKTIGDLTRVQPATAEEPFEFPEWNRSKPAGLLRRFALPLILPLARLFAWIRVEGLENLRDLKPPVIFASNHQSHFDVPSILWALPGYWRYRTCPAMAKEFFDAHFHPTNYSWHDRFTSSLNYYLAALVFQAFPLPQRESGTREALRYAAELASDGKCILIFPEGKRTDAGEILPFQPGVGMLASRLRIPVVPVRIEGLERVLHKTAKFPAPGRARVKLGAPINVEGEDYAALAKEIQEAVENL